MKEIIERRELSREEAEVSALTLPEYRRRGYFKELLQKGIEELARNDVQDILFVSEEQSAAGRAVAESLMAEYDFTEYRMYLRGSPFNSK